MAHQDTIIVNHPVIHWSLYRSAENRIPEVMSEMFYKRRFFLHPEINNFPFLHGFSSSYQALQEGVAKMVEQGKADLKILQEKSLFAPAVLEPDQSEIKISIYGSGIDIIGVYPALYFKELLFKEGRGTAKKLSKKFLSEWMVDKGGKEKVSPDERNKAKEFYSNMAERIFKDANAMEINSIVLLMKTRFDPSEKGDKLPSGNAISMWPLDKKLSLEEMGGEDGNIGLAYMMYLQAKKCPFWRGNHLITGMSRGSHPKVSDWFKEGKERNTLFNPYAEAGYDCKVLLAVVK